MASVSHQNRLHNRQDSTCNSHNSSNSKNPQDSLHRPCSRHRDLMESASFQIFTNFVHNALGPACTLASLPITFPQFDILHHSAYLLVYIYALIFFCSLSILTVGIFPCSYVILVAYHEIND